MTDQDWGPEDVHEQVRALQQKVEDLLNTLASHTFRLETLEAKSKARIARQTRAASKPDREVRPKGPNRTEEAEAFLAKLFEEHKQWYDTKGGVLPRTMCVEQGENEGLDRANLDRAIQNIMFDSYSGWDRVQNCKVGYWGFAEDVDSHRKRYVAQREAEKRAQKERKRRGR